MIQRVADRYLARLKAPKPAQGVRGTYEIKSQFDVIDEWVTTRIVITIDLYNAEPISEDAVKAWAKANWTKILAEAPSKTPRTPEGRGMSYDEPSGDVGFIAPNRIKFDSIENFDWTQHGNTGEFTVSVSDR